MGIKKIGAFQSRIENIQNEKDSKFYTGLHNLAKLSAHEIFGLANDVFGYNGWSSLVMDSAIVRQEFRETEENIDGAAKYSAKFSAVVRVTLRDGYWNEQVGQGVSYSLPSKYQCFSKCKKEAVTDGMKKAIIGFRLALLDYERIKKEEE